MHLLFQRADCVLAQVLHLGGRAILELQRLFRRSFHQLARMHGIVVWVGAQKTREAKPNQHRHHRRMLVKTPCDARADRGDGERVRSSLRFQAANHTVAIRSSATANAIGNLITITKGGCHEAAFGSLISFRRSDLRNIRCYTGARLFDVALEFIN